MVCPIFINSLIVFHYNSQPKLCYDTTTVHSRVISSTHNPNQIVVSLTQQQTIKLIRTTKVRFNIFYLYISFLLIIAFKIIHSLLIIVLDNDDRIVKVENKWDGRELSKSWSSNCFRRLNAKLVYRLVKVPKDVVG